MFKECLHYLLKCSRSVMNESVQKSGPPGRPILWAQGRQPCLSALSLAPRACPPCNFCPVQNPQTDGCRRKVSASACHVTLGVSLPHPALSFPAREMEKWYHVICMDPAGILSPRSTVWGNKIILVERTCSDPQAPVLSPPSFPTKPVSPRQVWFPEGLPSCGQLARVLWQGRLPNQRVSLPCSEASLSPSIGFSFHCFVSAECSVHEPCQWK